MRSQQPTSYDVAELAGVSVATVSYVMNGRTDRRIPAETRARVRAAADELAYVPNQAARSLRRKRTEQVCLVVGSIGVPMYDEVARDLHTAADEVNYGVLTIVVDSTGRAAKAVELLHKRVADGAVIAPAVPHLHVDSVTGLARSGLPLVLMRNTAAPDGFDVIRAPESAGCAEAFDHLIATGRRRIAFVGHHYELDEAPTAATEHSERLDSYRAALDRHGIAWDERLVVTGADDRVASYHAVADLLREPHRPDAIFAASGRGAISAIWAIHHAGLAVPDDVAVIGSGNLPEGLITRPTLSTVGPPAADDFSEVARLLFERLHTDEQLPGREVSRPWSFVRRESA